MKIKRTIILVLAVSFLIYGFATNIHPWDYMACGVGGLLFGTGIGINE
jgi:NO-binding membrane sensor protein with MHYT domain